MLEKYIPEVAHSLSILSGEKETEIKENMEKILKKNLTVIMQDAVNEEKNE